MVWLCNDGTILGLGHVGVQNIKVVDPLPAKAVFVTASDGGVYDPATHTVTWNVGDVNPRS